MTYSIDGNTYTNTTGVFTSVAPGTYIVTAKNSEGCISSTSVPVTIYAQPAIPQKPKVTIGCEQGPGSATVTVTDPLGIGYEYKIDDEPYQPSPIFTAVKNGAHRVTVKNSSECTAIGDIFNVSCGCSNPPVVTIDPITGSTCSSVPVSFHGTFSGSSTSVSITHDGSGTLSSTNVTSSPFSFTYTPGKDDASKIITVTITTNNPLGEPCFVTTATCRLTINPEPATPSLNSIIQPNEAVATGSVILEALPPSGTWTVVRDPGNVSTPGSGQNATISGIPAGEYTFRVINAAGCRSLASAPITIYPQNMLKVYDPDSKPLSDNDVLKINQPGEGSILLTVESLTSWSVSENSLWLSAEKEENNRILVKYLENISSTSKNAEVSVSNIMNNKIKIIVQQPALVSVDDINGLKDLQLYPNPTHDYTYLLTGDKNFDLLRVTIMNQAGEVIYLKDYKDLPANYIMEIDLTRFDYGIYHMKVSDGNRYRVFTIIRM